MTGNEYSLVLRAGEQLSRAAVTCPSGEYVLAHQHDGNLVLYRCADAHALWATNTVFQRDVVNAYVKDHELAEAYGDPGRLVLTPDGDLVVLSSIDEQLWASGTAGKGIVALMIHDWGKLVLKNAAGHILWSTERAPVLWQGWNNGGDGRRLRRGQTLRGQTLTSDNGRYQLVSTFGGVTYLARVEGPVLWAKFHHDAGGEELTAEGLLGSRRPDGSVSAGNRLGVPHDVAAAELAVADDGRLELRDEDGRTLWAGPAPDRWSAGVAPARAGGLAQGQLRPHGQLEKHGQLQKHGQLRTHGQLQTRGRLVDARLRTESTPLIRTDFSDETRWLDIRAELLKEHDVNGESVSADLTVVDDRDFAGLTADELVRRAPDDHGLAFVVDATTIADPERAVLVLELDERRGRTFRALPSTVPDIEINLEQLANMDWDDFADNVDEQGILR